MATVLEDTFEAIMEKLRNRFQRRIFDVVTYWAGRWTNY
jgi:hypothetical protein